MVDAFKEEVLLWANNYIAQGWFVFPCHTVTEDGECSCGIKDCADKGKHPKTRRGLKEASNDPAKIDEWFGAAAEPSNIAIVTGEKSGITVIDIDIGPGKEGAESWAEAIKDHGEPDTLVAETGSGGMHFVFKYNSALKTASNVLGKGVDVRNDSGYIIAAPSRHKSGGTYKWLDWEGAEVKNLPGHLSRRKDGRGRPRKDDISRQKYSLEQVRKMLAVIPSDDRDRWRAFGIILGRAFNRVDEAWQLYQEWSATAGGKEGRGHSEIMHEAFYTLSAQSTSNELSMATIVHAAIENGWAPTFGEVPAENFIYYAPGNSFVYRPTATFWVAEAVNAAASPINENGKIHKPADWLRMNMLATSMTKDPGLEGDFIKGIDYRDGMAIERTGAAVFNSYFGPTIEPGDAKLATPFLEHVRRVFNKPGDADQFLNFMAHRVQFPEVKPRFALLIAGDQGVGKDTAVEFCCAAIGSWNVANIEPTALDTSFNEYAAAVLVRVSEAANLHDMNKWAFNERMKVLIAGTPDTMTINPKYGHKYSVRMHCGVIVTTNHMLGGIYIPQDDRRYDVIDSASKEEMGLGDPEKSKEYFSWLWDWFVEGGGDRHVAALLLERDLSGFSAANGQRKTEAHASVVRANLTSDHWLIDALDELGEPDAVKLSAIVDIIINNGGLTAKEIHSKVQPAMARCGYYPKSNPERKDGRWNIDGKYTTVYGKRDLNPVAAKNVAEKIVGKF